MTFLVENETKSGEKLRRNKFNCYFLTLVVLGDFYIDVRVDNRRTAVISPGLQFNF